MKVLAILLLLASFESFANADLLQAVSNDDFNRALDIIENDPSVDINILNEKGRTPLIISAEHNNEVMAWMLIDKGADIEIKDSYGNTASVYSHMHRNPRLFTYLDANMKERTFVDMVDFVEAVKACDTRKVDELIQTGRIQYEYTEYDYESMRLESIVEIAAKNNCIGFLANRTQDPHLLYNVGEETKDIVFNSFAAKRAPLALNIYDKFIRKHEVSEKVLPDFLHTTFKYKNKSIASEFSDSLTSFKNTDIQNALYIYAQHYGWSEEASNLEGVVDGSVALTKGKDKLEAAISCGNYFIINSNLECATVTDKVDTMNALLETGTNVSETNALHYAVFENKMDYTKLFIKYGSDLNKCFSHNENACDTPLKVSITEENVSMAKLLIQSGANVNKKLGTQGGFTTHLMAATESNLYDISKLLIENNAEVNVYNDNGSALNAAISQSNLKIAELLLENGAQTDNFGINYATRRSYDTALVQSIKANNKEMVNLILKYNPSLEEAGLLGKELKTPLSLALETNIDIFKTLIGAGADVNRFFGKEADTALTFSAKNRAIDTVKYLSELEQVDINFLNGKNKSALSYAVQNADLEMAKVLTNKGIQVDIEGANSLLYTTLVKSTEEIVNNKYANTNFTISMLETLLNGGADVNRIRGNYIDTPLMTAYDVRNLEAAKLFIDRGANVNFINFSNETALSDSIEGLELDFSKTLVSADAKLKYVGLDGKKQNLKWELFKKKLRLFKKGSKEHRVFARALSKHIRQERRADRKAERQ